MVYSRFAAASSATNFEVDSTESVWYTAASTATRIATILKLTPQSQYGISDCAEVVVENHFEVDSTESVWYIRRRIVHDAKLILKLTPQSQYGIFIRRYYHPGRVF